MATEATATSLRESSRWLGRLAKAAMAVGGVGFLVFLVSAFGLVQEVREASRAQEAGDVDADADGALPTASPIGGTARTAATVVSWTVPVALLAGIGAALTAHRAAALADAELSRRLVHLRRPAR